MAFKGLSQEIFATYSAEKWSSMVHNLARMKAKETMLALCDRVQEQLDLTEGGVLEGLVRSASDEIPNITNQKKVDAQWVFWFRGPQERENLASFLKKTELTQAHIFDIAPQDKHATLAVVLREAGLWMGVRVAAGASVDRQNLASKLDKSWERETLAELLAELPEGSVIGSEPSALPAKDARPDGLAEMIGSLGKEHPPWVVGHSIAADEAIELGTDLPDLVARWLGVLVPIYRFAAWTRDNDFIEAGKAIKEEKEAKRRQATSYQKGDRVRVINGMFTGKNGVVESVDTKAKVRVRVGKMSVVVSGHDLVPAP